MDFGLESEFTNYLIIFIYIFKINTIQKYPNLPFPVPFSSTGA